MCVVYACDSESLGCVPSAIDCELHSRIHSANFHQLQTLQFAGRILSMSAASAMPPLLASF